jgi:ATP-dependent helicase HrpA
MERRAGEAMIVDRSELRRHFAEIREKARRDQPIEREWEAARRRLEESLRRRASRDALVPAVRLNAGLPVAERAEEIAEAIRKHQVVVICGETGSGKTTQIPQICLRLGRGRAGDIAHTQPRRIAARAVASRVAEELGVRLGEQVGFKVRFGDETSERTLVKLMTDGILLAETQGDRLLERYDTIIVDEAHERSLNIDFLLGYLRRLLPQRPELKVIITSATIDPDRFSRHFGGAPVVMVSGRTYPVEVRYRPVRAEGWESEEPPSQRDMDDAIVDATHELTSRDGGRGDVLVFLSGEREIRDAADALRESWGDRAEILPLYARLTPAEQQRVFAAHSKRRIVLATNVAETSLTVPGIRYVVDTGVARLSRYSPRTKVQRLPIEAVSKASANQRSGRCGRTEPGVCIRLYDEQDFAQRPDFTEPEILRTNLASVILQMKSLRLGRVEEFPFIEAPDDRLIKDGYETLHELGAIDEAGELTELGRRLARLPIDPRLGRMLLAAEREGCVSEMLVLCSAMSVQDVRERPLSAQQAADQAHARYQDEQSDFLAYLKLWKHVREQSHELTHSRLRAWCRDNFISIVRLREWREVHAQLRELAEELGLKANPEPAHPDKVHRALLSGLLSNVGARGDGFDYQGCRGTKFTIFPGSVLFKKGPKWLMAQEVVQTTKLYARTCARIQPEWVEDLAGHVLKRSYSDAHWQEDLGQVAAFERVTMFGLTLVPRRRVHYGPVQPALAREILIDQALVESRTGGRRLAFLEHNQGVIAQVKAMEAKIRRTDILATAKAIFAFYDRHLPADVFTLGALEKWLQQAQRRDPGTLRMTLQDVVARDAGEINDQRYPDLIEIGPSIGECVYRLNPGEDDDGLTLVIPLEALPALSEDRAEWLIPGWLDEKIHLLLRALPKSLRVQLDPITDLARQAADALPARFAQGSLLDALGAFVKQQRGVEIPRAQWNPAALPRHLRMNVRVLDEHARPLAEGKDVGELKQRLAGRLRKHLAAIASKTFAREGITGWDFGPLPGPALAPAGIPGCPALADRGESVAITLETTPLVAQERTRRGVRRLFALAAQAELDARLQGQKNWHRLCVLHATIGEKKLLLDQLRLWLVERVFLSGKPLPQSAEEFDARLTERWGRLGLVAGEVCGAAEVILDLRHKLGLKLEREIPDFWADLAEDLRDEINFLTAPGFFAEAGDERLVHFPRYLEAAQTRLHKLLNGNERRDRRSYNALAPLWRRYTIVLEGFRGEGQGRELEPGFVEHRWLLQELRVSLFAERLGTPVSVSAKRINDHWASLGFEG